MMKTKREHWATKFRMARGVSGCGVEPLYSWAAMPVESNPHQKIVQLYPNYTQGLEVPCGTVIHDAFEFLCWKCAVKAGWVW